MLRAFGARATVRCGTRADRRLSTGRWRDDEPGQAVDLNDDGNLFSFYFRSRMNVAAARGGRLVCGDLRAGCGALRSDLDAEPYSLLADAHRPDG